MIRNSYTPHLVRLEKYLKELIHEMSLMRRSLNHIAEILKWETELRGESEG